MERRDAICCTVERHFGSVQSRRIRISCGAPADVSARLSTRVYGDTMQPDRGRPGEQVPFQEHGINSKDALAQILSFHEGAIKIESRS
jgi:hypothetical protein